MCWGCWRTLTAQRRPCVTRLNVPGFQLLFRPNSVFPTTFAVNLRGFRTNYIQSPGRGCYPPLQYGLYGQRRIIYILIRLHTIATAVLTKQLSLLLLSSLTFTGKRRGGRIAARSVVADSSAMNVSAPALATVPLGNPHYRRVREPADGSS